MAQADFASMATRLSPTPSILVQSATGDRLAYLRRPDLGAGRRDSERNCISNIHAAGLSYSEAATKLEWLMTQARLRQLTGIGLKEAALAALPGP
jgi:ethanolamine ammonia-lyase small subunit